MKKVMAIVLAIVLVAAIGAVAEDMKADMGATKWFDPANCEFCKHMIENPELLSHMTHDYYDIHNGTVAITTVAPEFRADYKKAMDAMMALAADMESGKRNPMEVKMDGQCQAYGMLMMAGAKADYVTSDKADVMVMTANDEETVKKIHDFAERNRAEMAVWKAEEVAKHQKPK